MAIVEKDLELSVPHTVSRRREYDKHREGNDGARHVRGVVREKHSEQREGSGVGGDEVEVMHDGVDPGETEDRNSADFVELDVLGQGDVASEGAREKLSEVVGAILGCGE